MNKKILTVLSVIGIAAAAYAVPADRSVTKVVNPDGSVVEVRMFGDEHFSFMTDAEAQYILEPDKNGDLKPAIREGRSLQPVEKDINLLRREMEKVVNQRQTANPVVRAKAKLPELDNEGRSKFPTVGDVKGLCILLEYSDVNFSIEDPNGVYQQVLNEEGYSLYGGRGSAKDYFKAVSNGKFNTTFDVYGPVVLPETSKYYTGGYRMLDFYKAAAYAVQQLDDIIDYSQYDFDNDGVIDNVFFYFAGFGQNQSKKSSDVWPHQDYYDRHVTDENPSITLDGVKFNSYACSNELHYKLTNEKDEPWLDGIGTFCHEFGHVLGLPDLYDSGGSMFSSTESPAEFSIMDTGSYNLNSTCPPRYSGYEMWFCHWAEPEPVVEGTYYSLESMSLSATPRFLSWRVPTRQGAETYYDEWFFFETRTQEGWDEGLGQSGMAIWRVNYDPVKWSENKPNQNKQPNWQLLEPYRAKDHSLWPGLDGRFFFSCPGVGTALVPQNSSEGFSAVIDDIKYDDENKTTSFGLNRLSVADRPDVVATFNTPLADQEKRDITLSWSPVEGARDYLLTVTCYDEDNWLRYVGSYDETTTFGANSVTIENVMEKFWDVKMTATVRAVTELPSTNISDKLVFTPSKLSDDSGVNDVVSLEKEDISAIIRKHGTRIYDVFGREYSRNDLKKGIYIIVEGGKSHKINIK